MVAENGWADLTDGELLHPVERTETKVKIDAAPWTNTKADGTAGPNHCNFWTNSQAANQGGIGLTTATDATWTDAMSTTSCSGALPLYCIEDV